VRHGSALDATRHWSPGGTERQHAEQPSPAHGQPQAQGGPPAQPALGLGTLPNGPRKRRPSRLFRLRSSQFGEERIDWNRGERRGRVRRAVRDDETVAVDERSARIDDVGHVAVALLLTRLE
jgi:hypothetical protein